MTEKLLQLAQSILFLYLQACPRMDEHITINRCSVFVYYRPRRHKCFCLCHWQTNFSGRHSRSHISNWKG